MPEWVWGHKTVALFDVWSIEHVLSGLSLGTLVVEARRSLIAGDGTHPNGLNRRVDALSLLFLAYLWETAEHYLEAGAGVAVTRWFAGVEMWGNRMVTDPLLVLLGFAVVARYPGLRWPARALSGAWVIVHVFVFPDCMYLHELF